MPNPSWAALRVLQDNARFLASVQPWVAGGVQAGCHRLLSSCQSTGSPEGSAQDSLHNAGPDVHTAKAPSTAMKKTVRSQSNSGSQYRQPAAAAPAAQRPAAQQQQQQQHPTEQQQQPCAEQSHATTKESVFWPQAVQVQGDTQLYHSAKECSVVLPAKDSPLWGATFYANVPVPWLDLGSKGTQCSSSSSSRAPDTAMGRRASSSTTSSITSWSDAVAASSLIQQQYRLAGPDAPKWYWVEDGVKDVRPQLPGQGRAHPKAEINRLARARLQHQLHPLYPLGDAGVRIAYARRRHRATQQQRRQHDLQHGAQLLKRWQQLQEQLQQQRQQRGMQRLREPVVFNKAEWQALHAPHQQQHAAAAPVAAQAWRPLVCRIPLQQLRLLHQQRFRLRSRSYVAAAAAAASAAIRAKQANLPIKQAWQQYSDVTPRRDSDDLVPINFTRPWLMNDTVPRISCEEVSKKAAQFLATAGRVSRCTAQRNQQGSFVPLPRQCKGTGCSSCSSSSSDMSSGSKQALGSAPAGGQQQQQQQQSSSSSCVAGTGCDTDKELRRGRKRRRQLVRLASPSSISLATGVWPFTNSPSQAAAAAAGSTDTPAGTAQALREQQGRQQQQEFGSSASNSGAEFVFCGAYEVVSEDEWDSESEEEDEESSYDSDYESDDEFAEGGEPAVAEAEEVQLHPVLHRAIEEPYVFRNHHNIIYGFWSKCPMG